MCVWNLQGSRRVYLTAVDLVLVQCNHSEGAYSRTGRKPEGMFLFQKVLSRFSLNILLRKQSKSFFIVSEANRLLICISALRDTRLEWES